MNALLGVIIGLGAAGLLLDLLLGFDPEAEKDLGKLDPGWIHRKQREEERRCR